MFDSDLALAAKHTGEIEFSIAEKCGYHPG
jgi:hypothetical protein